MAGLDPGGKIKSKFGWAMAELDGPVPKLRITGRVNNAQDAVAALVESMETDDQLVAVGIDAPMFWTATGDRVADHTVKAWIKNCGAPFPFGTVQHVNSLSGACLVQGMMAAHLLRRRYEGIRITEAHPKALLWLLDLCSPDHPPNLITGADLAHLISGAAAAAAEDERDALLGIVAAVAMYEETPGWTDLVPKEKEPIASLADEVEYWMPSPS